MLFRYHIGGAIILQTNKCVKVIVGTAVTHNICEENGTLLPSGGQSNLHEGPEKGEHRLDQAQNPTTALQFAMGF